MEQEPFFQLLVYHQETLLTMLRSPPGTLLILAAAASTALARKRTFKKLFLQKLFVSMPQLRLLGLCSQIGFFKRKWSQKCTVQQVGQMWPTEAGRRLWRKMQPETGCSVSALRF